MKQQLKTNLKQSKNNLGIIFFVIFSLLYANPIKATDTNTGVKKLPERKALPADSILANVSLKVTLEKALTYDKHTLKDEYKYNKKTRKFQWDKIEKKLAFVDSVQRSKNTWGIMQNYKNKNGLPPLVKDSKKDAYNKVADRFGVERTQGIPLYYENDTVTADRYGHDGAWVKIINNTDTTSNFISVQSLHDGTSWKVPKKYIKILKDDTQFKHVIVVDVKNQNIVTIEKADSKWLIRSMNPSTTGKHSPPHMQETPVGAFLIQEKKSKMYYLKDGTTEIAGFAPYASRFSDGGYIHGVPLVNPNTELIEYSWTLGTVPRSHMCVRNATSHAKFIYDSFPANATLLFVID